MEHQPAWIPRSGQRIRYEERNGRATGGVVEEAENGSLSLFLDDGRKIRSKTGDTRVRPICTKGLSSSSSAKPLPASGSEVRGLDIFEEQNDPRAAVER